MAEELKGKRIAILATDGFEQSELLEPKKALEAAGAEVDVVSPTGGEIQGMQHHDKGQTVPVDVALDDADPGDYDALVQPGGVANPDELRTIPEAVRFFGAFLEAKKPVAVICHGPWMLIEAGHARGRTVTSWPSLKTDLENAGAKWVDREVVVDSGLVTSRKPDDLPAFCAKMVEEFREGLHKAA
jgi:protease I